MMSAAALRRIFVGCGLVGFLALFSAPFFDSGTWRTAVGAVAWACFVSFPVLLPVVSIKSGYIQTKGGITYRASEPARFWIGLITYEAFFVVVALLFTLFFFTP